MRIRPNQFLLGVTASMLAIMIGGLAWLRLGLAEVRADVEPAKLQVALMNLALRASVRRNAKETPNPIEHTDEVLIAGGKRYLSSCAGCHGTPGKLRRFPPGLIPSPRQFADEGTEYSEAQVFWIAKNGIRRSGMFVFGYGVSDPELWKIAAFVKRMNDLPAGVKEKLKL